MRRPLKSSDGVKMHEKETSQITSQLNSRIQTNKKFGSIDLDEWLFEKLEIKNGHNVLDVGCGTGNHIIKLAEFFPEGNYYGIDISKNSIIGANKAAEQKKLNVKFICGDASEASLLEDGFFDLIISVYALYYVRDAKSLLAILKKKLKKNGRIAVMSPYKGNNNEWYSFLSHFMKIPKEVESIADNFMGNEVLPFANANFSSVQTFHFQNRVTIPSFEHLRKYWVSNVYHKEEFDKEFEKHAKEFFTKKNEFVITKKALLAIMG